MNLDDLKILSKALKVKYDIQKGYWYSYRPDSDPEKAERDLSMRITCLEFLDEADTLLYLKSLVDAVINEREKEGRSGL